MYVRRTVVVLASPWTGRQCTSTASCMYLVVPSVPAERRDAFFQVYLVPLNPHARAGSGLADPASQPPPEPELCMRCCTSWDP